MTVLGADLYADVPPLKSAQWREAVPGLLLVALGTLSAGFLSDRYGAPLTLMSLLIGLALNFLATDKRLTFGLEVASKTLLRWGIVLVGTRITAGQIVGLGPVALISVMAIVAGPMLSGVLAARRLGFDASFGVLAGGAVAICGASAAMALATTLGSRRVTDAQLTLVLVGISAMSASAMVLYPLIAHALALSDLRAGFLLGASIHDVAQALGAGYAYSETAGQIAAIVKLTRVALLAPVLAVVAFTFADGRTSTTKMGVPWFVVGFFGLAGINSLGVIPGAMAAGSTTIATAFLAAAVTATGIRSPLPKLLKAGPRPLLVILCATLVALGLALLVTTLLLR